MIESAGGQDYVDQTLNFYRNFLNSISREYTTAERPLVQSVHIAELQEDVVLFGPNGTLTVAINSVLFWNNPTGEESISYMVNAAIKEITSRDNHDHRQVGGHLAACAISMLLQQLGGVEAQLDRLGR